MRSCFPTYLIVRVFAVLLFMSGIIVGLVPAQRLLLVRPMNWEKSFLTANPHWKKHLNELAAETKAEKNDHSSSKAEYETDYGAELNAYIEKKSKGRKIYVSGKSWIDLFDGRKPLSDTNGYFAVEESIFNQIKPQLNLNPRFFYLMINDSQDSSSSLAVEVQKSGEFLFKAPIQIAFPWLYKGLFLFLGAVAIYLMQTGGSQGKAAVRLNSDYTGRGSDLLAAVMVTFMTGLGALIAANISFTAFSQGWLMLVGGFTISASLFASIWLFTAYYRTLSIEYGDDRIVFGHLFGNTEIDAALVRSVKKAEHVNPGWMKFLLKLGRIAARNKGEEKHYQDRVEPGFCLMLSTGQSGPVMKFQQMTGLSEFFDHLEQAGAEIEAEVRSQLGRRGADD